MKIAFISSPCAAGQPPLRDFEMKARKTTMSVRALRKPFARAFAECSHTQKQSTTSSAVLDATSEFSKIALKHFRAMQRQSTTSSEVLESTSECSQTALEDFSGGAKAVDKTFEAMLHNSH